MRGNKHHVVVAMGPNKGAALGGGLGPGEGEAINVDSIAAESVDGGLLGALATNSATTQPPTASPEGSPPHGAARFWRSWRPCGGGGSGGKDGEGSKLSPFWKQALVAAAILSMCDRSRSHIVLLLGR